MITVFTPTYNRKKLLKRCYESLKKQTAKNFEWLIIDDGSKDGTKTYVEGIIKEANFKIKYIYQENGGKHRAHNTAVRNCNNEYFLILDSDDILDETCIEVLNKKTNIIEKQNKISGIIGNKYDLKTQKVIGTYLPQKEYLSGIELYQKYGFYGDTLRLYKTSILKKYLFPEIDNEKFMAENVVFDKIDQNYKMMLIFDKLYYSEYQENGYSNNINQIKLNNPVGYLLSLKTAIETSISVKKKVGWTILYIMWCRIMKIKGFKEFKNKFLFIILYPVSFVFQLVKYPKFFFNIFNQKIDNN